jgi:hypothetical protein
LCAAYITLCDVCLNVLSPGGTDVLWWPCATNWSHFSDKQQLVKFCSVLPLQSMSLPCDYYMLVFTLWTAVSFQASCNAAGAQVAHVCLLSLLAGLFRCRNSVNSSMAVLIGQWLILLLVSGVHMEPEIQWLPGNQVGDTLQTPFVCVQQCCPLGCSIHHPFVPLSSVLVHFSLG